MKQKPPEHSVENQKIYLLLGLLIDFEKLLILEKGQKLKFAIRPDPDSPDCKF